MRVISAGDGSRNPLKRGTAVYLHLVRKRPDIKSDASTGQGLAVATALRVPLASYVNAYGARRRELTLAGRSAEPSCNLFHTSLIGRRGCHCAIRLAGKSG
jgi:hypothetical protein